MLVSYFQLFFELYLAFWCYKFLFNYLNFFKLSYSYCIDDISSFVKLCFSIIIFLMLKFVNRWVLWTWIKYYYTFHFWLLACFESWLRKKVCRMISKKNMFPLFMSWNKKLIVTNYYHDFTKNPIQNSPESYQLFFGNYFFSFLLFNI